MLVVGISPKRVNQEFRKEEFQKKQQVTKRSVSNSRMRDSLKRPIVGKRSKCGATTKEKQKKIRARMARVFDKETGREYSFPFATAKEAVW